MSGNGKNKESESEEFRIKVEVHQGSVHSPLLVMTGMEPLTCEAREGLPWKLLHADDLVLTVDGMGKVEGKGTEMERMN